MTGSHVAIVPGRLEAEQRRAPAVLEDEHEHAVGGGHRQQVEHDRLDRDDDRAERHHQDEEAHPEHEQRTRAGARSLVDVAQVDRRRRSGRSTCGLGARRPCRASPGGRRRAASRARPRSGRRRRRRRAGSRRARRVRSGLTSTPSGAPMPRRGRGRARRGRSIASAHRRRGDVVGLDGDDRRAAAAGERRLRRCSNAGPPARSCGSEPMPGVGAASGRARARRARAATAVAATAPTRGRRRTRSRIAFQTRPARRRGLAAAHERQAPAVDAVAELGQHRGEHGDRADHRDRDDDDDRRSRTTCTTCCRPRTCRRPTP